MFCSHCNQFMAPGQDRCEHCGTVVGAPRETGPGVTPPAGGHPDTSLSGEADQSRGAYFTAGVVRNQAGGDHYPWAGQSSASGSPFQRGVSWLVSHLWWAAGAIVLLLLLVALFSGGGAWDFGGGVILLLLAGYSVLRRGPRGLVRSVLLAAIAVALFSIGGRALFTRPGPVSPAGVPTASNSAIHTGGNPSSTPANPAGHWRTVAMPEKPIGLGQAGSGHLWVFEAQPLATPVDRVALVDESSGATIFDTGLATPASAWCVDKQGVAWEAENGNGRETLLAFDPATRGSTTYTLPSSIAGVAGMAGAPGGLWLVVDDPSGGLAAARFSPAGGMGPLWPVSSVRQAVDVAGSPSGRLWVVLQGLNQPLSVDGNGTVHTYSSWPGKLGQVAAVSGGSAYITGYAPETSHHVHLLAYQYGQPGYRDYPTPQIADMPGGLAVSPNRAVFLGFSAVGGGHGLPGLWELQGTSVSRLIDVPLGGLPGGGVGAVLAGGGGDVWLALPFSRVLLQMS